MHEPFIIKDFKDYLSFIADLGDLTGKNLCLFRGQNCDKPLIPKIGRLKEVTDIISLEIKIITEFKRRYLAHSKKAYDNDWDILALAQHFGLPTRLLDWTESALIALYFATEFETDEKHSIVWLFKPEDNDEIDSKLNSPFNIPSTKVFSPNHISERITAQQGWFTCHKLLSSGKFLDFTTLKKYKSKMVKLCIPKKTFPEIRAKLNLMGVNSSTVYPDLDGLSRYLIWKHIKAERS